VACRAGEQSGSEDDDAPNTSRAPYLYELAVLMTDRKLAATAQTSAGEQPTGRCGIRGPGGQWYIGQDLEGHQWGPVERAGVWTRKEFAEAAFPALKAALRSAGAPPFDVDELVVADLVSLAPAQPKNRYAPDFGVLRLTTTGGWNMGVAVTPSPFKENAGGVTLWLGLDDLEQVQIRVTARCPECTGSGVVYDPLGFGWPELLGSLPSSAPVEQLDAAVKQRMQALGIEAEPPQECPCPECDATGRLSRTLSLAELGELIDRERASADSAIATSLTPAHAHAQAVQSGRPRPAPDGPPCARFPRR